LLDGGFEDQKSPTISNPWNVEGQGFKGIDLNKGLANSGRNNAWIRTSAREWNAITQFVPTAPLQKYLLEANVRTSLNVSDGYFGVRDEVGRVIQEIKFGPLPQYTRRVVVFTALPRQKGVLVFVGYWGPGNDSWIQIDDVHVGKAVGFD
jgi:hypothetical protein